MVSVDYSDNDTRFYIVGSERAPNLKEPYRSMSDKDLIRYAGQSDDFLEDVYTPKSLYENRFKVFASYLLTLSLLEFWLGTLILADDSQRSANSPSIDK